MKTIETIMSIFQKKFSKDIFFNGISFFFVSISVILINTIIGKYYGVAQLGIYHTCLSLYIVVSVFTTLGIPNSLLKNTAEMANSRNDLSSNVSSGILIIFIFSLFFSFFLFLLLDFEVFKIPTDTSYPLKILLFSLPLFSVNKGCRGFFNGMRYMKIFAIVDLGRWFVIFSFIICCVLFNINFISIFYSFIVAEILIFIALILCAKKHIDLTLSTRKKYYSQHIVFGMKTILGGSLLIINNKIDILLISFLTTRPESVGIYAFAADIAKGLLYFSNIVQINFSPIISKLCSDGNISQLKDYMKKVSSVMLIITGPILVLIAVAYPIYISWVFDKKEYYDSISVFYVLLFGVGVGVLFFWYGTILSMAGYPQDSIKRNSLLIIFNVLLSATLIPFWGIMGAAISSSLSYLFRVFTLEYYLKKRLGFNLISLTFNKRRADV
jgi:O-antigen/teichoic acid export membrane protein